MSDAQRRVRYAGRKALLLLLVAAMAAALAVADRLGLFGQRYPGDLAAFDGKSFRVHHVVDGDTLSLDVADANHEHTVVRLLGIDTPECVKPGPDHRPLPPDHYGPEASAYAKDLASGATVKLELDPARTRDKYDRVLAYVYLPDGRMLNRILVEEGYAYADPRFPNPRKAELQQLQRKARSAKAGLWQDVQQDQLPYYYRDTLKVK